MTRLSESTQVEGARDRDEAVVARRVPRRAVLKGAAAAAGALMLNGVGLARPSSALAATPGVAGATTGATPYLVPSAQGVQFSPILTVGDKAADNGYRMVGIPDGLGAFTGSDGKITLVMNHELGATAGIARKHGSKGAFVSQWSIDKDTLRVVEGKDATPAAASVNSWDVATKKYVTGTTVWDRFCSGDLPAVSALSSGERGTTDRLYFAGEEVDEGRAWAFAITGASAGQCWQLPLMGRMPMENIVLSPYSGTKTVAFILDDGNANTAGIPSNYPCEFYVYIGEKTSTGSPVDRAGLTNGKLYGLRVRRGPASIAVTEESNELGLGDVGSGLVTSARFQLVELGIFGDVSGMTGLQLEWNAIQRDVTRFQRIEDGAWDPRADKKNDFYVVTTASFTTNSRLWRLRFDDIANPLAGGAIDMLLKGSEGIKMMDNLCIDTAGRIVIQEDIGAQAAIGKVWLYGIESAKLTEIAQHNPALFTTGAAQFQTIDEESSGVIDAKDTLGEGWFLLDVQSHAANSDPELVQNGQLLAMYVPLTIK